MRSNGFEVSTGGCEAKDLQRLITERFEDYIDCGGVKQALVDKLRYLVSAVDVNVRVFARTREMLDAKLELLRTMATDGARSWPLHDSTRISVSQFCDAIHFELRTASGRALSQEQAIFSLCSARPSTGNNNTSSEP